MCIYLLQTFACTHTMIIEMHNCEPVSTSTSTTFLQQQNPNPKPSTSASSGASTTSNGGEDSVPVSPKTIPIPKPKSAVPMTARSAVLSHAPLLSGPWTRPAHCDVALKKHCSVMQRRGYCALCIQHAERRATAAAAAAAAAEVVAPTMAESSYGYVQRKEAERLAEIRKEELRNVDQLMRNMAFVHENERARQQKLQTGTVIAGSIGTRAGVMNDANNDNDDRSGTPTPKAPTSPNFPFPAPWGRDTINPRRRGALVKITNEEQYQQMVQEYRELRKKQHEEHVRSLLERIVVPSSVNAAVVAIDNTTVSAVAAKVPTITVTASTPTQTQTGAQRRTRFELEPELWPKERRDRFRARIRKALIKKGYRKEELRKE